MIIKKWLLGDLSSNGRSVLINVDCIVGMEDGFETAAGPNIIISLSKPFFGLLRIELKGDLDDLVSCLQGTGDGSCACAVPDKEK